MMLGGEVAYLHPRQGIKNGLIVSSTVQEATVHDSILFEDGKVLVDCPVNINCT